MATGLFTLKQVNQAICQSAWNGNVNTTYAGLFNGSNQYLTTPTSSNLALGTSSFTLEYWMYQTAFSSANVPVCGGGSSATYDPLFGYGNAPCALYLSSNGSSFDIASAQTIGTVKLGQWYHVAIVRNGTTFYTFLNGVQGATFTSSASIYQSTNAFLIANAQASQFFNGQISNVRFVKGTALYTANFTPPNSALTAVSGTQLLTLQNATIVDNSTNAFTLTNTGTVTTAFNSGVFGPVAKTPAVDYLVVAGGGGGGGASGSSGQGGGGGAGGLLTGLLPVATGTSYTVTIGAGGTGSASSGIGGTGVSSVFGSISTSGGGGGGTYSAKAGVSGGSGGGSGGDSASSSTASGGQGAFNQGNAGGNTPLGGVCGGGGGAGTVGLNATGTYASAGVGGNGGAGIASSISGTVTTYAGGGGGSSNNVAGTGGVGGGGAGGVTTAAGTSGTANTGGGGGGHFNANTVAGAGGSGIVIISYPDVYAAATTVTGTYTVSTSGSGSIAFNGSSAYIRYAGQSAFAFGTGDFTIEGWFYVTSLASGIIAWDFRTAGTNGAYGALELSANGQVQYYANSAYQISSSAGLNTINTWAHIAITRSGTSTKLFFNGTQVGSTYSDSTNYLVGVSSPYIGSGSSPSAYLPGYISNFRVVKGTAVYTANFTPSTTPLTAISGTSLLLNSASGAYLADGSTNGFAPAATAGSPTWNAASPFTGTGYKNRVYTWTSSGSITF